MWSSPTSISWDSRWTNRTAPSSSGDCFGDGEDTCAEGSSKDDGKGEEGTCEGNEGEGKVMNEKNN